MSKITQAQIWIIAAVLIVITVPTIIFLLIKPSQEAFEAADAKYLAAEQIANKMPTAKTARVKAEQDVARAEASWRRYDRALMPNIDISNLIFGTRQLWHEQIDVLGPKVDKYLMADKTVTVTKKAIAIPAPSPDPNAVNKKLFVFDLGSVEVTGTFANILKHAERWNRFDRLVLMDNLTLSGNSPRLVGQYKLTCYEFTHGDTPGKAIPQAAPAQGGGAFPGGAPAGVLPGEGDNAGAPPPDGAGAPTL